jgi:uncharacterized membrane protein
MPALRSAGNGWIWITEAWALFLRAPLAWVLITIVFVLINLALALSVVGSIASAVLGPVFGGGIMLGCQRLHEGGTLRVADLFAGFRTRFGALAAIGAFSLVVTLAVVFVAGVITGVNLFAIMANPDPDVIAAAMLGILLTFLIVTALTLPLAMALWFAVPLVVLRGRGAFASMGQSFVACLVNMLPFLIYGLVLMVLAFLASIPAFLGWLVLGPVLAASVYTGYRDIFSG